MTATVRDDSLRELLAEVDAAPTAPSTGPLELASKVRLLHRRRMRRNQVLASAGVFVAATLVWQSVRLIRERPRQQPPDDDRQIAKVNNAPLPDELRLATKQIDIEQRILDRLLVAERQRKLATMARQLDSIPDRQSRIDEQVGRAAMAILVTADAKRSRPELVASAREDYASVIDLFPHTPWSAEAKQRLAGANP
ncbi:MAG TPA: hypothetical protein VG056_15110 [Pirellulales bacterium]|nr:hypothetical protein [Pirellulales bacterium]